jgi:predicted DsbA family dithiol-disulfide isomerase
VIDKTREVVQAGFQSTPTFFIGLTKDMKTAGPGYTGQTTIIGAQPFDVFKTAIEELLKKSQ